MRFKNAESRGILKDFVDAMRGRGVPVLDIPWATEEQGREIRAAVEHAVLNGGKWWISRWNEIGQNKKDKIFRWISTETVHKALWLYDTDSRNEYLRELFYMAWQGQSELGSPLAKVTGFTEVMAEELVAKVCKNGPVFTKAIMQIYESEFTDLMRYDHIFVDGNQRVVYAAARAIGDRTGEAAKLRLRTIVSYINGMGNDSSIFSGNFADIIDEAKSVLEGMAREDEFNKANPKQ